MRFSQIDLSRIDLGDRTFDISYKREDSLLESSIKRVGVINPVILLDEFENQYKIISGFSRIAIIHKLLFDTIPALIYSAMEITGRELFLLRLEHNFPQRSYNHVEKGIILHKARDLFDFREDEIIKIIFSLIGLDKGKHDLDRYREIVFYEERLKERLADGRITLATAKSLSELSKMDFESSLKYIDKLNPSSSNQKHIIELLDEIASREGKSIESLLGDVELSGIIDDEKMTSSQKCAKYLSELRAKRSPLYSEAERHFRALIKKLKLPSGVHLEHSPFFESSELKIEINVTNSVQFEEIMKKMSDIALKKEITDIFQIDEKMKGLVEG